MGIGSSQEPYDPVGPRQVRPPRPGSQGGKKRRRRFFRRSKPEPTAQPVPSSHRPHSPRRHAHHSRHINTPAPTYVIRPRAGPPAPVPYNRNYAPFAYPFLRQPMMMMPQQQLPVYNPMMMPTGPPMMMPQQAAPPPPPMVPPYMYAAAPPPAAPQWIRYPQAPPAYNFNNAAPTGMAAPAQAYRPLNPLGSVNLLTDWTGGGVISPGFLGPPI